MTVSDFLREVRRMVVDFVVGRVLTGEREAEVASGLDDVTTYYLPHRDKFRLGDAPAGARILYALSCNLTDRAPAAASSSSRPSGRLPLPAWHRPRLHARGDRRRKIVDALPDVLKAAAGASLRFRLAITLVEGDDLPSESVASVNDILERVHPELRL